MKKITLTYDESTGTVTDGRGIYIGMDKTIVSVEGSMVEVDVLVKLKNAGFTTDEIIELHRKELL